MFGRWFFPIDESDKHRHSVTIAPLDLPFRSNSSDSTTMLQQLLPLSTELQSNHEKKRPNDSSDDPRQVKKPKSTPLYLRRNIRKVLSDTKLQKDTLAARALEEDRLKRLEDNRSNESVCVIDDDDDDDSDIQCLGTFHPQEQLDPNETKKLRRLHLDDRLNVPDSNGQVLVNTNHPTSEPDLYISPHLTSVLKPHQIGGIRFLYDNVIESLHCFRTTPGLGCILAHSMGCGKTLQVITFVDIFFRYTIGNSLLIIVPVNTLQNWINEFHRWCPVEDEQRQYKRPYSLYSLDENAKTLLQRAKIVQDWSRTGGVLVIGYEMFRSIVTKHSTSKSSSNDSMDIDDDDNIGNILLSPGVVICDEGHRIKNQKASIAQALKSIRTQRRIVLTGYPLQNNLIEYWCMVDFVRPNYLGRKEEFSNLFERPIRNGQCLDSTPHDRAVMRARAHVLHSRLEGFVQRRGHDVLQKDLPSKTEYVLHLKLSNIQRKLYKSYVASWRQENHLTGGRINPIHAFAMACKIWNHPDVLHKSITNQGEDPDLDSETDSNFSFKDKAIRMEKKGIDYGFAKPILGSYETGQLADGTKFAVALRIIEKSILLDDKVLLFSQSLFALDKFEEFLGERSIPNSEEMWEKNVNYYRLDGSTRSFERDRLIESFNASDSRVKLFLVSTRAGCLGINLTAANRVIMMDVSWNPCLDAQAVCRVYRYGQKKHCYIYRLIADCTMEKRIYDRQVTKQNMSGRVVDELQPESRFTRDEVENLLHFFVDDTAISPDDLLTRTAAMSDDPVLLSLCKEYSQSITRYPFTHESLLTDRKEDRLTFAEKLRAQKQYEDDEKHKTKKPRSTITVPVATSSIPKTPPQPMSQGNKLPDQDVRQITLRKPLSVHLKNLGEQILPTGTRLTMFKSDRGSFIRTEDGRVFGIRPSKPIQPIIPPSSNRLDQCFRNSLKMQG